MSGDVPEYISGRKFNPENKGFSDGIGFSGEFKNGALENGFQYNHRDGKNQIAVMKGGRCIARFITLEAIRVDESGFPAIGQELDLCAENTIQRCRVVEVGKGGSDPGDAGDERENVLYKSVGYERLDG